MNDRLPPSRFARLGRALAHRNFRLFFVGQAISLIGTWMQQVAMLWLVYRLTESSALLGVTGFMEQVPTFFLAPFVGVLSDRVRRYPLLILTQSLMMLQAFVLAGLVYTERIEIWHLIALSGFLGVVQAFDSTTRQGFLSEMVPDKADLGNAIALNSSIVNGARLVGPAVAGFLIALTGEAVCFLSNAVSYLAVLGSLLLMRVPVPESRPSHARFWHGLREGFVYAFTSRPIRSLLLLMAAVSFLGMPYTVLMPVIVVQLHGGPELLGWLMTASGIGALLAALILAGRTTVVGLGLRAAFAPLVFGLGLIAFALSSWVWLSLLILPVMGYALMTQMASVNTILQTIVSEDKRGRVMSFYMMAFLGTAPLGSLTLGYLAEHVIGASGALIVGGLGCITAAGLFLLQLRAFGRDLHAIYRRLNILPSPGMVAPMDRPIPPIVSAAPLETPRTR